MIKLYTDKEKPVPTKDVYLKIEVESRGLRVISVTESGEWIKNLFTLSEESGIVRNYSANDAGFPTEGTSGKVKVN